jgi:hypothetical protein
MLVPDCSKPKQTRPMIRLFTDKAKMQFRNRLLDVDWNKVCEEADINEAYSKFSSYIETSFNLSFPKVRLSRQRAKDKKMDNSSTKKSSRTKAKLYKRWLLTKSKEDEEKFKEYRKQFKKFL